MAAELRYDPATGSAGRSQARTRALQMACAPRPHRLTHAWWSMRPAAEDQWMVRENRPLKQHVLSVTPVTDRAPRDVRERLHLDRGGGPCDRSESGGRPRSVRTAIVMMCCRSIRAIRTSSGRRCFCAGARQPLSGPASQHRKPSRRSKGVPGSGIRTQRSRCFRPPRSRRCVSSPGRRMDECRDTHNPACRGVPRRCSPVAGRISVARTIGRQHRSQPA